jgi:hypothetical protein
MSFPFTLIGVQVVPPVHSLVAEQTWKVVPVHEALHVEAEKPET